MVGITVFRQLVAIYHAESGRHGQVQTFLPVSNDT